MNKLIGLLALIFLTTISWAQEDINFTYAFNRDNSNIINVNAKIINNSTEDIYFLSESCNGLDYYLTTTSDSAEILILLHCNATFPRKIELKANTSYKFETIIQLVGDIEKIGLNLKLVRLMKSTEVEGKFIDEIRKENTQRTLILEGPIKKIK
jgi:hypothetical protein